MFIDEPGLLDVLGLAPKELQQLLDAGLPHASTDAGRAFDTDVVHAWLVENQLAVARDLVDSVSDVAKAFGVHERTVYSWKNQGMPGRTGEYDLDEIRAWREGQTLDSETPMDSERAQLLNIERRQRELKLQRMLGEVAPVEPWFRRMSRRINEAKTVLLQFPDMVTAIVEEAHCPTEVVATVRRRADETIRQVCEMIADLAQPEDAEAEIDIEEDPSSDRDDRPD